MILPKDASLALSWILQEILQMPQPKKVKIWHSYNPINLGQQGSSSKTLIASLGSEEEQQEISFEEEFQVLNIQRKCK